MAMIMHDRDILTPRFKGEHTFGERIHDGREIGCVCQSHIVERSRARRRVAYGRRVELQVASPLSIGVAESENVPYLVGDGCPATGGAARRDTCTNRSR